MELDEKTLLKLTQLARIATTAEESGKLRQNLSNILAYIDQLQEVDTDHVEPCRSIFTDHHSVMREDEAKEPLDRALFLSNAPSHIGGMIKVPLILKQQ